jgi:glyoxylase-like metal-dependent hydrolase (beta-lactamase superfamily II)
MKTGKSYLFVLSVFILLALFCSPAENFIVKQQVTGPIETNCYLLYDTKSKEAALFDVGGPIDSLLAHIDDNNLKIKYIFATHCHMDHIEGKPEVKNKFPNAQLCYNKHEYQDFLGWIEWVEKNWNTEELAEMKNHPE